MSNTGDQRFRTKNRKRSPYRRGGRQAAVLLLLLAATVGSLSTRISAVAQTRPAVPEPASLADAVEAKDTLLVTRLIAAKADVDRAQVDGMTALHWAVYQDDVKTTKQLLVAGAKPIVVNRYGVAPLSLACQNGNAEIVAMLLASGADVETVRPGNETVLMTAARTGKPGPVKLLLAAGANVNARQRAGQTALMWAAAEGHVAVVEALLRAGADFRLPLNSGFTPLFFAVREGRSEVVKALIKAGADANGVMRPKKTNPKSPRAGTTPLMLAVENGHFDLAVELLEYGADPNNQRSGYTPLHALTWVRKPNRGDGADGDPAPAGSGKLDSLQFVRRLVAAGADVNTRLRRGKGGRGRLNHQGATALLLAAKTADAPLIRLLLELGANPDLPNVDQCTALMAAAGIGTIAPGEEAGTEDEALEVARLLLELGADINAVDKNGETAMHGAAYKSLPKMVQLLAERGARIDVWNRKNKYSWTPLLIAEGHRPGNFKPSVETVAAIHRVMRAAGVTPPPPRPRKKRKGYQ